MRPKTSLLAAVAMASIGALGGQVAAPAATQSAPATQSKDQMPAEARQRVVAKMVLRKKRTRVSGQPRGDGYDDARRERARLKRARKLARPGGWRP